MTETAILKKIMTTVKKFYPRAYVRKLADRHNRGMPDLIIMVEGPACLAYNAQGKVHEFTSGVLLFVEVKKPGTGRLSKIQQVEHEEIARAGGRVIVATSPEEVLTVLQEMGAVA